MEINPYVRAVQDEASHALSAAGRGDYDPAWQFAKDRPGLILGIVVPLATILRFPWLISGAFGIVMRGLVFSTSVVSVLEHFLPPATKRDIADYLWRRMIASARSRKNANAKSKAKNK